MEDLTPAVWCDDDDCPALAPGLVRSEGLIEMPKMTGRTGRARRALTRTGRPRSQRPLASVVPRLPRANCPSVAMGCHRALSDVQSLRRSPDPRVKSAHKRRMRLASCGVSVTTGGSGRLAASRAFLACSGPNATNCSSLVRLSAATVLRLVGSPGARSKENAGSTIRSTCDTCLAHLEVWSHSLSPSPFYRRLALFRLTL